MKTLDIIVPQFKENTTIIAKLLKSIYTQKKIDLSKIGVIIINDFSKILINESIQESFPKLNITFLKNTKNLGPGLTRQIGIDHSKADYITFLDADDTYYTDESLFPVFNIIENENPDILLTKWAEEVVDNGAHKTIFHNSDIIYLHGKFIKRQYLIDNNIKFNPELRYHEDSYFSTLLLLTSKDYKYSDTITNYWRYSSDSIVRKKEKYHYLVRTFSDLIKSNLFLYQELDKRKSQQKDEYAIKACSYAFYILSSFLFANKNDSYLQKLKVQYEKEYYDLLIEALPSFSLVSPELAKKYMDEQLKIFLMTMPNLPFIETWHDFIIRLDSTYSQ